MKKIATKTTVKVTRRKQIRQGRQVGSVLLQAAEIGDANGGRLQRIIRNPVQEVLGGGREAKMTSQMPNGNESQMLVQCSQRKL